MDYTLKRWAAFTRFLDDGRICMTNNAAERAVRGIAVGRRNWTFCGSDSGGQRAAVIYTLIETAKLNDVDPRAWLADVLAHIADHPMKRIDELLPWKWKAAREAIKRSPGGSLRRTFGRGEVGPSPAPPELLGDARCGAQLTSATSFASGASKKTPCECREDWWNDQTEGGFYFLSSAACG